MQAQQASAYLERKEDMKALPRIALRRIEHLYYKNDVVYDAMRRHTMAKQVRSPMPGQIAWQADRRGSSNAQGQGAACFWDNETAGSPASRPRKPCEAGQLHFGMQEAQAAGQAEEEAKEAQDEHADLGDEDEPTEEAAVRSPANVSLGIITACLWNPNPEPIIVPAAVDSVSCCRS